MLNRRRQQQILKEFVKKTTTTARGLAKSLGTINSMQDAILPVRVHTSKIYTLKNFALTSRGWDTPIVISKGAMEDLRWCITEEGMY